jgi:hypothetical protein
MEGTNKIIEDCLRISFLKYAKQIGSKKQSIKSNFILKYIE